MSRWLIALVLATASMPSTAQAAPVCKARDGFGPALFAEPIRRGRSKATADFRLFVQCEAGAEGRWTLAFENAADGKVRPLKPMHRRSKPRTLPPSRRAFDLELSDRTSYCSDLRRPQATALSVRGPAGRRFTAFEAEVRARFVGTGALEGLTQSHTTKVYCPACIGGRRGSIYVRITNRRGGGQMAPHLEVRLDPEWLECVRSTSTLSLRLFAGDSRRTALEALRPYAVIDGLERRVTATGRDRAAKVPLDEQTICRRGNGWISYELWGDGELHRASGGGRGAVEIRCP